MHQFSFSEKDSEYSLPIHSPAENPKSLYKDRHLENPKVLWISHKALSTEKLY